MVRGLARLCTGSGARHLARARISLSLGSKEHKTPNRLMRNVRTATEQTRDLLCSHGVECTFELNPGNHFQDPDLRMARGIRWILD